MRELIKKSPKKQEGAVEKKDDADMKEETV